MIHALWSWWSNIWEEAANQPRSLLTDEHPHPEQTDRFIDEVELPYEGPQ